MTAGRSELVADGTQGEWLGRVRRQPVTAPVHLCRPDVRLEIQNLHNEAFDVEQVTKRFFDDYTKVYFGPKEGRRVHLSFQPQ